MILVAVPLSALAVRQVWSLTERQDRERTLQEAMMLAEFASMCLERGQVDSLQRLLDEFVTGDPLCFVQVTNTRGEVQASARRTGEGGGEGNFELPAPPPVTGVPAAGALPEGQTRYLHVSYPVNRRSDSAGRTNERRTELLGYVHLGFNRTRTIGEFDAAADLVIGIGIAVVLALIPLGFLVVRRIVVPLNEMSQVARRFSNGETAARCRIERSDEIGVLANSLDSMADEVTRKQAQILRLNAGLERRVQERTAQLRELASREPLTGLYNRRYISEMLGQRFAEARRYGNDLALMMIDMDDFKAVNDTLGHQVGDKLLILTANTISSQLRSADVAARFGGDEFIVMLPQSNREQAQTVAERILEQFVQDVRSTYPRTKVSLSIGIASLAEVEAETNEEFLRAADSALYEAKALGKSQIVMSAGCVE